MTLLPSFVQQMFMWVASKSPHLFKQNMGTVELNAIGMFGRRGGWGIHIPFHTLSIVAGGIASKPGVIDERIEIREYLNMTINHELRAFAQLFCGPMVEETQRSKEEGADV